MKSGCGQSGSLVISDLGRPKDPLRIVQIASRETLAGLEKLAAIAEM